MAAPSEKQILDGADARIQRYRTAEVVVRVLDVEGKPLPAGTAVRIEQTRHDFLFGCNIFALGKLSTAEENSAYEKYFSELLNYATLPFYWWGYETEPGNEGYKRIEEIAAWCTAHKVTMKGHPLAWNFHDPQWIPKDIELAEPLQMARIFREVNRYKGTIDLWDVVNEATAYDRKECWKNSPVLTGMIHQEGVGPYLREAFKMARAANPKATLVINDYRVGEDYAAKVLNELFDDSGKPMFDVIGIQSHQHDGPWPVTKVWDVCESFARYGKPLHFTETTFLSGALGRHLTEKQPGFKWVSTPEGEQRQAAEAARFYTVLFSHPAVEAITWWDFADKGAFMSAPAGLLGQDLKPKPAYVALKKLIKGKWWTQKTAKVADDGTVKFRGFYGDYRLMAGAEGAAASGTFGLHKGAAGSIEVRVKQ